METINTANLVHTKQQLLKECIRLQQMQVNTAKSAMDEAQESANEEAGSMEDKFESFREACQIQRDMYAKQLDEAMSSLAVLKRIQTNKLSKEISVGSLVITDLHKYFVSISLGEVEVEGEKYFAISPMSPLYKAMAGKKEGESFTFRDKSYKVQSLF